MDQTNNEDLENFFTSIDVPENFRKEYIAKCFSEFIPLKTLLTLDDARLEKLGIRMGHRLAIINKSRPQVSLSMAAGSSSAITGELNFTVLPTPLSEELTPENLKLRQKFYIGWANSTNQKEMFQIVITQLHHFFKTHYLELPGNNLPEKDILNHLLENTLIKKYEYKSTTISPRNVKLEDYTVSMPIHVSKQLLGDNHRTYCSSKFKNIGYCHLYLNKMVDTTSSSCDTYSEDDYEELPAKRQKKKRKTCQNQKWVDYDGLLGIHQENCTNISGEVVVDILIFCRSREKCGIIASHFGFIFLDKLLEESPEFEDYKDINFRRGEISNRLSNVDAKLYRLIQSLLNQKLIFGLNNVCFTCYNQIFKFAKANMKAVIDDDSDRALYMAASSYSSITIKVNNNMLEYISAIAEIVNATLCCKLHMNALYCKQEKVEQKNVEKKFYDVKFSLANIIPLYILRFIAQLLRGDPENWIEDFNIKTA